MGQERLFQNVSFILKLFKYHSTTGFTNHFTAMWPWANYLTFQCFNFFIFKIGLIIVAKELDYLFNSAQHCGKKFLREDASSTLNQCTVC